MRKAERILKKCNEYYALVSRAQRIRAPLPTAGRLGLERALLEQPKPFAEFGKPFTGFVDAFGKPIAPIEPVKPSPVAVEPAKPVLYDAQNRPIVVEPTTPASTPISGEPTPVATESRPLPSQLEAGIARMDSLESAKLQQAGTPKIVDVLPNVTLEFKQLQPGQTLTGENKIVNRKATIYTDKNGNPLAQHLPEEIKQLLKGENKSLVIDKIKSEAKQAKVNADVAVKSNAKFNFDLTINKGDFYSKFKEVAKAYKSDIYMYSAGAVGAVVILGVLYSLFTGDSPKSKNAAVGNKLKESVDEKLSTLNSSGIIKSNELANQVNGISELVKKHHQLSKNPENQQILRNMSNILDDIHLNLSLKSFIIDDKASQTQFSQQLATLNSSIEKIFNDKYLSRFSAFLKAKNENDDAAKVEACERNLANYRQALVDSNRAAQSSGNADSATT